MSNSYTTYRYIIKIAASSSSSNSSSSNSSSSNSSSSNSSSSNSSSSNSSSSNSSSSNNGSGTTATTTTVSTPPITNTEAALAGIGTTLSLAARPVSYVINYPAIQSGVITRGGNIVHGLGGIRDSMYGAVGTAADTFNVFETPAQREKSVAHTIGKEIGNFFLPKVFDSDDLGPYEEYSDYLKDTEQGEMYLNQAAVLRRAARKVLRERKQKEMEREHASSSRYF